MPKVSVIIPVYNEEKYLRECLDSVCQQTLKDIEIICVDDGSTDSSLHILRDLQQKDNRIVIVAQKNLGVFTARNKAINKSTGEYIAFMDADDLYLEDTTLEKLYNRAKQHNVLICGGSVRHFDDQHNTYEFSGIFTKYIFPQEGLVWFKDYQFDFGYQRFVFNRQFLVKNNIYFPPYRRFQDPPFFLKAMILAQKFWAVPDITYCYRVGHQADPHTWPDEKLYDLIKGWIDVLRLSREAKLPEMHSVAVNHVEDPYTYPVVMDKLRANDSMVLQLLLEANANVDTSLLKKASTVYADYHQYVIKELRDIVQEQFELRNNLSRLKFDFDSMAQSLSFRVGRKITWLPRKIRDSLKGSES